LQVFAVGEHNLQGLIQFVTHSAGHFNNGVEFFPEDAFLLCSPLIGNVVLNFHDLLNLSVLTKDWKGKNLYDQFPSIMIQMDVLYSSGLACAEHFTCWAGVVTIPAAFVKAVGDLVTRLTDSLFPG
jgi:isopenicillin N synthase-like dioxygenase